MYNELLVKANEELKKVTDYIEEHADMFDMHDLKLHDVSYYIYSEMEKDFPLCYAEVDYGYFETFCNIEYDEFINWCEEHDINFDKMIDRVGRTSKFYLHKWNHSDKDVMLYTIIEDLKDWCACQYYTIENGQIIATDIEEYEEDTMYYLSYVAEELYNDFIKAIADMIEVYEYIKGFKKNQVEYFKDFLYGFEEQLSYEEEMKIKAEKEKTSVVNLLQRKYDISDADMELLLLNI